MKRAISAACCFVAGILLKMSIGCGGNLPTPETVDNLTTFVSVAHPILVAQYDRELSACDPIVDHGAHDACLAKVDAKWEKVIAVTRQIETFWCAAAPSECQ